MDKYDWINIVCAINCITVLILLIWNFLTMQADQQIVMSDLVFKKGEWYHDRDGKLVKVDYEKEVKEYYKNWRTK